MRILKNAMMVISGIICVCGFAGMLLETTSENWYKYLFIFFALFVLGIFGVWYFKDTSYVNMMLRKIFKIHNKQDESLDIKTRQQDIVRRLNKTEDFYKVYKMSISNKDDDIEG